MCDFSPNIPKVAAVAPPPPPGQAPKLADPLAQTTNALGSDGQPIRSSMGLSSLRIDRPGSNGLTIPRG